MTTQRIYKLIKGWLSHPHCSVRILAVCAHCKTRFKEISALAYIMSIHFTDASTMLGRHSRDERSQRINETDGRCFWCMDTMSRRYVPCIKFGSLWIISLNYMQNESASARTSPTISPWGALNIISGVWCGDNELAMKALLSNENCCN